MSVIKKPDLKIFAQDAKTGEIESFPDILRGWGITLERTAGKPPLEWFNAIGKRVDEWLMYLTQRGVAEWDASLSYPKTAIVQFNNIVYVSVKETKGEQPDKSQASWSTLGLFLGLDKYSTTAAMNLELNKKMDKANISGVKGNDNDKVPSLNLFTTEVGKLASIGYSYSKIESDGRYQPKGNYAPAGDYVTNTTFKNELNKKFDVSGGQVTGAVIAPSFTVKYGNVKNVANIYSPQSESGLAYFQYSSDNSWFGRLEIPRIDAGTNGRLISNIDLELGTGTSSVTVFKDGVYYPMLRLKRADGAIVTIEAKPDEQNSIAQLYRRTAAGQIDFNITFPKRVGVVAIEGDSYTKNESNSLIIGINQKWTNVTSSRSKGATYTNTTGKPIMVAVSVLLVGSGSGLSSTMTVDNFDFVFKVGGVSSDGGWKGGTISMIIPANSKYKLESVGQIESWGELL